MRDSQPADSPLDGPARQILPVVVRGGQFPINPVTRRHIEDALQNGGLLNYRRPAAPIARIAPLDLEELEICETLRETRNLALHDLIRQWQQSADYAESSFRSFLSQAYGGPSPGQQTFKQNSPGPCRSSPSGSAATGRPVPGTPDSRRDWREPNKAAAGRTAG